MGPNLVGEYYLQGLSQNSKDFRLLSPRTKISSVKVRVFIKTLILTGDHNTSVAILALFQVRATIPAHTVFSLYSNTTTVSAGSILKDVYLRKSTLYLILAILIKCLKLRFRAFANSSAAGRGWQWYFSLAFYYFHSRKPSRPVQESSFPSLRPISWNF